LNNLDLDHLARRYFFENDMLVHLNIFNVRVKDVPIPARYGQEKPHDEGAPVYRVFGWQQLRSHLKNPLSPWFGGEVRRSVEQGPHLWGCDREVHISTRATAALHPAPGSHPSTIRLEPAPPSAGAG